VLGLSIFVFDEPFLALLPSPAHFHAVRSEQRKQSAHKSIAPPTIGALIWMIFASALSLTIPAHLSRVAPLQHRSRK
jgi:hypothetical protein